MSEKTNCQCCGKKRAGGGMRFCMQCYGVILSSEMHGSRLLFSRFCRSFLRFVRSPVLPFSFFCAKI